MKNRLQHAQSPGLQHNGNSPNLLHLTEHSPDIDPVRHIC